MRIPPFASRLIRIIAASLALSVPASRGAVVINEIMAAASERLLKFDANGVPQLGTGAQWYQAAYSDSFWPTAPGPFGYGTLTNSPTAIATNIQAPVQYLTPVTYFRKSFNVSAGDQARADQVQLVVDYNDGIVVFLNGAEVARRNGGPAKKWIYHDQPAYNRETFAGTATIPTTTNSETINLGAAVSRLVSGNNTLAIQLLNATAADTTYYLKASLLISGTPTVALVNFGDAWKYLPGVVEPSGNVVDPTLLGSGKQNVLWGRLSFDDATWLSGPGPFGFGSGVGAVGTDLSVAMLNVTPSLYTRIVFTATAGQAADPLALKLVMGNDDGFIAYINGVEVCRRRIGAPNTFTSSKAVADADQTSVQNETILLDAASKLLVSGTNVLAIQGHNFTAGNADFLVKADLQTNAGVSLAANNSTSWKYFVGVSEPDATVISEEADSSPDGPDSAVDWVELYNDGASDVSLANWRISDDPASPAKWVFPNVTIPAGGYLVLIADNLDLKSNPGGYLHTNFKLDADGEYVGLYDSSGAAVSVLSPTYPRMTPFQSYARDAGGVYQYSDIPTPGAANAGPYSAAVVATPTVNNAGRFYAGSVSVTLSCATPGATIRYTTNGTEPTATSTIASGALNITTNTALRARAYLNGYVASDTVTHTYLISQSAARQSLAAVCLTGDEQQAFYRPFGVFSIVNNVVATNYTGGIWSNHPGATTLAPPNTAEDTSLYNSPMQSGKPAERPIAMEILHTDATADLRTGTFIRCAGSPYSRQRYVLTNHNSGTPNSLSPWTSSATDKPQINLFFRDDLGQSPLQYALVPGSTVAKYKNIRLRAGKNDITNPFIRDEFARRLMINMGQVTVRGDFVNTFVNGVFKGYFNICERPREPYFQEARGTSKSFDVRNITVIVDGDTLAYNEAVNYFRTHTMATLPDYQGAQTRIDVVNLADYILLNSDAAMADWPGNNYVMDRERTTTGLYRFSVWDGEGGYGGFGRNPAYKIFNDIVTGNVNTETIPAKLFYTQLRNSPEWKLLCADRIQKHFFNSGALADANKQALFNTLAARIQPIMTEVGSGTVSTFLNIWLNGMGDNTRYTLSGGTTGSIVNCPSRRTALFTGYYDDTAGGVFVPGFFPAQGIWPTTVAPAFSQFGGPVANGYQLTVSNPNGVGTIYYTTNGLDPRIAGGGTQGTAYGGAITLSQTTVVKARVLNNGEWSPLTEATFIVTTVPPLLITEIMYNPPVYNTANGDEFEFLEIKNTGTQTVNLGGMRFTDGIDYTFPGGSTLAGGAFVVLAKNPAQFSVKYPGVAVFGTYGATSSLSDAGETVTLSDLNNATIFSVLYDDIAPWPTSPDGGGYSLVPVLLNSNPNPNDAANWRASTQLGGSPGRDDVVPPTVFAYVNELLANPGAGQTDAVEISNPNGVPADISYWALSDSSATTLKYRFPVNTVIPAGGFLVVNESQFNPTPGVGSSFEFDRAGETVVLTSADQYSNPTGYTHTRTFGASEIGVTFGRYIDSVGVEHFVPQASPTLGTANSGPRIGPVIMSEIMYAPIVSQSQYRYVELRNISNSAVPLYDPTTPTNVWRVYRPNSSTITGNLPAGVTLQPRQFAVLIYGTGNVNTFRSYFNIPAAVPIYNCITGALSSSADKLVLQKPIPPAGGPLLYTDIDALSYNYVAPWPTNTHFNGPSLERINWLGFPGDAANWRASANTGGTPGILPPVAFAGWQSLYFTPAQSADANYGGANADPDLDGLTNFWEYAMGLNPLAADAAGATTSSLAMDGGNGPYLTMLYRRSLGASGLQDFVDTAAVPGVWTLGGGVQIGTSSNNGDGTETITRRDTETTSSAAQRFIRLRFLGN